MTRQELQDSRHRGYKVYGYYNAYCYAQDCCDKCDRTVRFWCKVKNKIEKIQEKRILKICQQKIMFEERTNNKEIS